MGLVITVGNVFKKNHERLVVNEGGGWPPRRKQLILFHKLNKYHGYVNGVSTLLLLSALPPSIVYTLLINELANWLVVVDDIFKEYVIRPN
jgi:hypothetical protein